MYRIVLKSLGSDKANIDLISTADTLDDVLQDAEAECRLRLSCGRLRITSYADLEYGVYVDSVMVGSFSITKLH